MAKVVTELYNEPHHTAVYQLQDMIDWRFCVVTVENIADSELEAKQIIKKRRINRIENVEIKSKNKHKKR